MSEHDIENPSNIIMGDTPSSNDTPKSEHKEMDDTPSSENDPIIDHEEIDDDDDYSQKMDDKLNEIRNAFKDVVTTGNKMNLVHESDSPLTISYHNSDDEDNNQNFKELSYHQVVRSLDKYYDSDNKYSNELDILITFMKGQKNLYIQSHLLCKRKLHMLMIPTILLSTFLTFLTPFTSSCEHNWTIILIAILNGITTGLITLINYLKLETSTQTFFNSAHQFDKLETSLEFVASKLMFIEDESEKSQIVYEQLQEVESKINEMKEWNSLFLPDEIRGIFPIICNINVFSFIKRIETNRKNTIERFKDVKNEIRYILYSNNINETTEQSNRIHKRLQYLIESKDKIKHNLLHYRNAYSYIDELFTVEIKNARLYSLWERNKHHCGYDQSNPVVDKYIQGLVR